MTLQDELESLVDRYNIEVILDKLANICHEKADHVLTNWQDKKQAKSWDKLGNKIQYASDTSTLRTTLMEITNEHNRNHNL